MLISSQSAKQILGALALASGIGGGVLFIDDRYENETDAAVTKKQVATVSKNLDVHILAEQIDVKQERIYKYEDRLTEHPYDIEAKQRIRELKVEKSQLEHQLEEVKKR